MFEVLQILDVVGQHLCTYVRAGGGRGGLCVDNGLGGKQEVACTNVFPLPTLINVINLVNYLLAEPFNHCLALFNLYVARYTSCGTLPLLCEENLS